MAAQNFADSMVRGINVNCATRIYFVAVEHKNYFDAVALLIKVKVEMLIWLIYARIGLSVFFFWRRLINIAGEFPLR